MARAARLSGRIDTITFAGCILLALLASALPVQMRDPIASSLRRSLVAPLVGLQRSAEQWRAAWLESERRTMQKDSLALQLVQAKALQVENDRLRRIMGLGSRLAWGFIPAEALHMSGGTEDVVTTLTLTAGSKAGVTRYSPVVAPEGIVGLVQTVDPSMSIAILFSHPDFRVSAMAADGSAFGIVYPHLDVRAGRLDERYLLELRSVPFRDSLKAGTAIYSSGLGGAWPRGVLIGKVMSEVKESESWSRTYLVQPAVNPANLTSVMILTPQRAAQGVGNIWANATQTETALRNIVTSGDSVARASALAEAAARRLALDSLRRASLGDSMAVGAAPIGTDSTTIDSALVRARRDSARARRAAAAARARRDSAAAADTVRRADTPAARDTTVERP
jgi:rod shape-determining protein MreC